MLNLSTILENSARKFSDKDAYIFVDHHVSYAQVNSMANKIANGLNAIGIKKGDKVALACLNIPYFPMIYFGILKAGAIVVPLSILLKKDEIAFHLSDSEAKAFFCFEGTDALPLGIAGKAGFDNSPRCENMIVITADPRAASPFEGTISIGAFIEEQGSTYDSVDTSSDDTAVIIYTSGTTGRPKGAQLSHSNLLLNAMITVDLFGTKAEDMQLIVLPLFHIFAMTTLMNAGLLKGASSVLLPRFDAATVLNLMLQHEVSLFAGVPTMYWGLLNYHDDNFDYATVSKNLRIAASGGASLPQKILEDFEKKFKVNLLEGYGMSEGSPVVTFNQLAEGCKPNSIGTPVWGVQVKLIDEEGHEVPVGEKGELIYKGHNVMKGYFNRPEANAQSLKDGWLHSGDIAIKDEDGFYFIVDRKKDMIIRGGLNVYPREVEEVMMQHPSISMVAVIGVPDDKFGEEIKACVVLKEDETVVSDEIIKWTKAKLAAYKYPREVEILDKLPLSATGKILKKELR